MIVIRRLGQRGEEGRLLHREVAQGLVEIVERRRRHAIGAETQIDFVQIQLEYPFLGKRPLDAKRQDRLFHLTLDRDLVGQQKILRHLLGDRRGAARASVRAEIAQVLHHGAGQADEVNARMAVEILIFGRQKRLDDALWHGGNRHENPAFGRVFGQQSTIAAMDPGHHRWLIIGQLAVIR